MSDFHPFATAQSITISGPSDTAITIETDEDVLSLYGNIDIPADKSGLATVERLQAILAAAQKHLSSIDLPDHLEATVKGPTKPNPFG